MSTTEATDLSAEAVSRDGGLGVVTGRLFTADHLGVYTPGVTIREDRQ